MIPSTRTLSAPVGSGRHVRPSIGQPLRRNTLQQVHPFLDHCAVPPFSSFLLCPLRMTPVLRWISLINKDLSASTFSPRSLYFSSSFLKPSANPLFQIRRVPQCSDQRKIRLRGSQLCLAHQWPPPFGGLLEASNRAPRVWTGNRCGDSPRIYPRPAASAKPSAAPCLGKAQGTCSARYLNAPRGLRTSWSTRIRFSNQHQNLRYSRAVDLDAGSVDGRIS